MSIVDVVFLRHPRDHGEGYGEHARFAAGVGGRMVLGGLACLVHAVVPCAFTTTGSRTVRELSERLAARRRDHAPARSRAPDGDGARVRG